jgi:hypothetical protein
MDIEEQVKKMPNGLKKFVDLGIDLLGQEKLKEEFMRIDGRLGGPEYFIFLVKKFINLEMEFDVKKVPDEYRNIKRVRDLPDRDIKMCLDYLNYLLGVTVYTGGFNFYELYKKM